MWGGRTWSTSDVAFSSVPCLYHIAVLSWGWSMCIHICVYRADMHMLCIYAYAWLYIGTYRTIRRQAHVSQALYTCQCLLQFHAPNDFAMIHVNKEPACSLSLAWSTKTTPYWLYCWNSSNLFIRWGFPQPTFPRSHQVCLLRFKTQSCTCLIHGCQRESRKHRLCQGCKCRCCGSWLGSEPGLVSPPPPGGGGGQLGARNPWSQESSQVADVTIKATFPIPMPQWRSRT